MEKDLRISNRRLFGLVFCLFLVILWAEDRVSSKREAITHHANEQTIIESVGLIRSLEHGDLIVCGGTTFIFRSATENELIYKDPFGIRSIQRMPITSVALCDNLRVVRKTDVTEYHREAVRIFSQ